MGERRAAWLNTIDSMIGRPQPDEADAYYSTYMQKVAGEDPLRTIENQLDQYSPWLRRISEEKSLYRYAPGKWSIKQVLNHISDTERAFAFRALWFARGFDAPLPSYDQEIAAAGAKADEIAWSAHVEEFTRVRVATISLYRNLPKEAWMRRGIASGFPFTVRALAFIIPGHMEHHCRILKEKYLRG
jgi:hypothetical protein